MSSTPHRCAETWCTWQGFAPRAGGYLDKWLADHAVAQRSVEEVTILAMERVQLALEAISFTDLTEAEQEIAHGVRREVLRYLYALGESL